MHADYVFVAAVLLVIGSNIYFERRITRERVAMQWRGDGKPTWHVPRRVAIWWILPFMIAVRSIIWLASTYAPQSVHGVEPGIALFSVIALASHIFVLRNAE